MKRWISLLVFLLASVTCQAAKLPDLTETTDPGTGSIMWVVDINLAHPQDRKITIPNLRTEMGLSTIGAAETLWGVNAIVATEVDSIAEIETLAGAVNILLETEIDASSELRTLMDDETGTSGGLVFAGGPTLSDVVVTGSLNIPNAAAPTTDATGELALDTTITDHKSLLQYDGGADEMLVIAIPRANLDTTDGDVIKYDAATDSFVMAPDEEGAGGADADAIHDNASGEIAAITDKATPVGADHLLIEDSEAANVKKDVTIASLEAALELVMDLQDFQGAVTDGQVPNNITIDLATLATTATTANAGDSATAFFPSGTLEDARLPSSMADKSITGSLNIPNGAAPTTDATGELAIDTTITDHKSLLQYDGGADEMLVIAIPRANLDTTDGDVIKYDAATDAFVMSPDNNSGSATSINDLGDSTGVGAVTLGHAQTWTYSPDGGTALYILASDADNASDTGGLKIGFNAAADANSIYLDLVSDADGTPASIFKVTGTTATFTVPVTVSGSGAGTLELGEGSAPSLVANTFSIYAPADVAAGGLAYVLPGAAASGIMKAANSGGVMTITHDGAFSDLSGSATDGQIPNNITIDLATLASTVTVVDGTDSTSFVLIADSATGSLAVKTDGGLLYNASNGTLDATILTESGNAVFNSSETPGGELGGTWASPTIDDSVTVATWIMTGAPGLTLNNGATSAGVLRIAEDSEDGAHYVEFTVPALAANRTLTAPDASGVFALEVDASGFNGNLATTDNTLQEIAQKLDDLTSSGAPTDIDYLVGTASSSLSAEIVVGTSPGGELGGTWASPTIDDGVTVNAWELGASTATTASADDNDTSLATTAYVIGQIRNTAWSSAMNTITLKAPSADVVYDWGHTFDTDDDGKVDVLDVVSSAGFLAVSATGVPVEGRTLTEGLAIDITNPTGAAGAPTFAFDPTELTGNRTWGDGTDASIIWTINLSGTDPTLTFSSGKAAFSGFAIPSAAGASTLAAAGDVALNSTDLQIGFHNGAKEVAVPLRFRKEWSFDPKGVCDGDIDRLMLFTVRDPKGITITKWKVSFTQDPGTEADLDFKRADAFIGVANSAVMDVLDTTAGVSSETTAANINGGAVVAVDKVLYLEFGTAYTEAGEQIIFEMEWEVEED